jgi:drug/metabolite transporter (DMT)-like permease
LIMSLEAVFAVLFGWLFLKESLVPIQIAGCILILAAVVLVQVRNGKMRIL